MAEEREKWGSSLEFILTVIGYAVGLGNVWRFPYLVFANGGGTFLIIFFLMLFLVGIPMFFLELALGQFTGLGPTHVFYKLAPVFQGLGYAALTINAFIGFYYNVIIAYCLYYLILSMRGTLPWSDCDNSWNTKECVIRASNQTCEEFNQTLADLNITKPKSPSEEFFYREVINLSDSIGNLGKVEWPVALALLGCWTLVFLALSKGVQSLGKVSYITATFPYVMLTVLVITGALLEGSRIGVDFYIGSIDLDKFSKPSVWKDATVQVFYALSACSGGLIAMSSFNQFKNNIIRDMLLIPILDCLTGLYAGFAIFTVLGYMYQAKCATKFSDVVAGGPELAFIVYPEGLSLIKAVPPLWSILFFLMMLALGFGSEFSIMETFMVMIMDMFKGFIDTKWKKIATRAVICAVLFLLGLSMTTEGGFYILSLINEYVAGYPLLIVGILQVVVVPWVYGCDRFIADIEQMVGPKPRWFWMIWIVSWKFVTPLVLIAITIATAILPSERLQIQQYVYDDWAIAIGWIIVAIPLSIIVACAVAQMILYKFNWRALISPDPEYYENSRRNLERDNEESGLVKKGDEISLGKQSRPTSNMSLGKQSRAASSTKVAPNDDLYQNNAYHENEVQQDTTQF